MINVLWFVFFFCFCFSASHEGSPGGEEVPLSTVWLQMQVGDAAEVPHDQTHRYQQDVKADHYILIGELFFVESWSKCSRRIVLWIYNNAQPNFPRLVIIDEHIVKFWDATMFRISIWQITSEMLLCIFVVYFAFDVIYSAFCGKKNNWTVLSHSAHHYTFWKTTNSITQMYEIIFNLTLFHMKR